MRIVAQRVSEAQVAVGGAVTGRIGPGLLLLVGFENDDATLGPGGAGCDAMLDAMAGKLCRLRVFPDDAGVMNRSVQDVGGEVLAVSQFTLFASTRKGNRPSWGRAAPGPVSQPLFDRFVERLALELGKPVPTGVFGADMQVALVNDGPVTIVLDSRQLE
jgi:D-tyrosyl-tRNA(Tyr) deacylase